MKQWTLLIVALLVGLSARAQSNRYYVGGNISLGASNYGTSIVVYPEAGMRVNPYLTVGLGAGFDWNNIQSESDFTMGFTRWTRRRGHDPLISRQTLGFRPGVYFPLGNVILSTQIGFFGWNRIDYGTGNPSSRWQARLEARDIVIGVLMNL